MSLGIFESIMAYLEAFFEFFDFGHSKPLFQLQNEVVSTIPGQYGDQAINQSAHSLCQTLCYWTDENLPLGAPITREGEYLSNFIEHIDKTRSGRHSTNVSNLFHPFNKRNMIHVVDRTCIIIMHIRSIRW